MVDMIDADASGHETNLRRASRAATVMLALVALGDFLIFGHAPGLNFFAYAVAIAMGLLILAIGMLPARPVAIALALALIAAVPLLETPSAIGMLMATLGLIMLAVVLAGLAPARMSAWPQAVLGFVILSPMRLVADWAMLFGSGLQRQIGLRIGRGLVVWIVPAMLALVFLGLFSAANPLIEHVLARFYPGTIATSFDVGRVIFWVLLALVLWPLLVPRLMQWRVRGPSEVRDAAPENLLFGQAAILRSLIVFNGLFAVQTGLDLTYLWGGAALPDGLTHADYAHRGAYPLIVTALLAAAFVLAAMRKNGPGEASRPIRVLVYAWIVQNILLCTSSILRLDLYVEDYSLTELRLAAGVWMGLVAVGLALILLRIALRRSNSWLVAMNLAALLATLFVSALVDFSDVIARFNVEHSFELTGAGPGLDLYYLERLGPTVIPALDDYVARAPATFTYQLGNARLIRDNLATRFGARDADWRGWSFRDWRLAQYIEAHQAIATDTQTDNK